MAMFKRKKESQSDEGGVLLLQGHDMIEQTAKAHADHWGLGSAERWDLDQTSGRLRFTFAGRTAEAPVQILGTYNPTSESWMWAWANKSLSANLCTASEEARAWGEKRGQAMLTTPRLEVGEEEAADLAALAFRLSGLSGFYRAPAGQSTLFLAFGKVTLTGGDGNQEDFVINVG